MLTGPMPLALMQHLCAMVVWCRDAIKIERQPLLAETTISQVKLAIPVSMVHHHVAKKINLRGTKERTSTA